jgi:aspartyl-tRNA(Asn)/glutamyl-tRNA(Gln) amidotransferase subunit A
MTALHELGVADLLDAYRRGVATPVDALDACLARIDEVEPCVGAVVTLAAARARTEAEASARRWRRGEAGPLDGVPFGVKDVVATDGVRTTAGWSRLSGWVPDADATAVARLRAAGAVLVAKLATPELAFGDAREGHRPVNPWAPAHWTGGSSSGPAAALAARELPLAVGTDTGGSIRVPSSYCGITGLKPTLGRVPRDGVVMVSWTLDHTGPMARSAADVGHALAVMAGRADADPASVDGADTDVGVGTGLAGPSVAGQRVGVVGGWFREGTAADVLAATDAAVAVLADQGAHPRDVTVPDPDLGGIAAWTITVAEFAALHPDWGDHLGDYTEAAAERLAAGTALSAGDYLRAVRIRADLRARTARLFDDVDVLVTPATPTAAPRIAGDIDPMFADGDRMWLEAVARDLMLWNLLGLPAAVAPAGFTDDGRPLAVQVVGPPFGERRVLGAVAAYQAATRHHVAAPEIDTTAGGPSTGGQDTGPGTTERRTSVSAAGGGSTFEMRHERAAIPTS